MIVAPSKKGTAFFGASSDCGYINYDEYCLDHGYITIDLAIDINIKGNIYKYTSATTLVDSVHVLLASMTCNCMRERRECTRRGHR
jgi:hypothetical protein